MFIKVKQTDNRRMRKGFFVFISVLFLAGLQAFGESGKDLFVSSSDIRLVYEEGTDFETTSGYHLYIRKKPGIESVMLVETTKDPSGNSDNFAYRAMEYNSVNGDEIRILNGKVLTSQYAKFSLIDSTPEKDREFGQAFHIFIPSEIQYGYPWSRNGKIKIGKGTFINIRSFARKYGDYDAGFMDNAFMFDLGAPVKKTVKVVQEVKEIVEDKVVVTQEEVEIPLPEDKEVPLLTDSYNPAAAESFKNIASFNGGEMVYSKGPETIIDDITASLERINPKNVCDVVFAIDATGSMKDDIQKLREEWLPVLVEQIKGFDDIRFGLLLYRDYGDTFRLMGLPVKKCDFTKNMEQFEKNLNSFVIYGSEGGDIPEPVYEALYASLDFYQWRMNAYRKIILIGDAEPHPQPRGTGKYTKERVEVTAKTKGVVIDAIIVPDDKANRGR